MNPRVRGHCQASRTARETGLEVLSAAFKIIDPHRRKKIHNPWLSRPNPIPLLKRRLLPWCVDPTLLLPDILRCARWTFSSLLRCEAAYISITLKTPPSRANHQVQNRPSHGLKRFGSQSQRRVSPSRPCSSSFRYGITKAKSLYARKQIAWIP